MMEERYIFLHMAALWSWYGVNINGIGGNI